MSLPPPSLMSGPMCTQMFGTTTTPFPGFFGILGNGWLGLTALAMLSSLLMLVLVYMFAAFIRNQQLMSWTKFELYQVLATSVVVIFSIMAIVVGMCHFDMTFLGEGDLRGNRYIDSSGQKMSMYSIVDKYFDDMREVGVLLFGYLMYVVNQINFMAKVMWMSSPLGVGSSESPLESLSQLNNMLFIMVSGFLVSFMLLHLQMRMIEYLSIATLFYLYPFGVFFRAFEPTRTFGGTLIGLSLAFMLFYPILLVFNDFIVWKSIDLTLTKLELSNKNDPLRPPGALDIAQNPSNYLGSDFATSERMSNELELISNSPPTVRAAMMEGFSTGVTGGILFLLKPLMQYFIGAVVLPVINFILLVEIARGVTHFFGDEIDVSNLTRLI